MYFSDVHLLVSGILTDSPVSVICFSSTHGLNEAELCRREKSTGGQSSSSRADDMPCPRCSAVTVLPVETVESRTSYISPLLSINRIHIHTGLCEPRPLLSARRMHSATIKIVFILSATITMKHVCQ